MQKQSAPNVHNFVSSLSARRMLAKRPSCARCAMQNQTRSQSYMMQKEIQSYMIQKERRSNKRSQPRFGLGISQSWQKLITKTWVIHDSLAGSSRYLTFFDGTRYPTFLMMSSILLLRLSRSNLFIIVSDDLLAWKT